MEHEISISLQFGLSIGKDNLVVVAITDGNLDFSPWEQIFYGEEYWQKS